MLEKLIGFIKDHKWTILFVLFGLLFAILLMTIGFWRTILVLAIAAVFFYLGVIMDSDGVDGIRAFFKRLFGGKNQ